MNQKQNATIKRLKEKVENLSADVGHYETRATKALQLAEDLKAKLAVVLERLQMVTTSSYFTNEVDALQTAEYRAKVTASKGLEKIAKMRHRSEW